MLVPSMGSWVQYCVMCIHFTFKIKVSGSDLKFYFNICRTTDNQTGKKTKQKINKRVYCKRAKWFVVQMNCPCLLLVACFFYIVDLLCICAFCINLNDKCFLV